MAKSKRITSPDNATSDPADESTGRLHPLTPGQRHHYVEVAAYYLAERRNFDAGYAYEDWAQAELEIDRLLAAGQTDW